MSTTYTCTMVLFAICQQSNTGFESVGCVRQNLPQTRLPSVSCQWLTWQKKIAYRLTNMGLTIQIPVQLLIPQWECKTLPSQVFKFVWVTTTRESATLSIKFRNDALIVGNDVVIDLGTKNVNCQAGLPCRH